MSKFEIDSTATVAVVGAGVAGAAAAFTLRDRGFNVHMFDKGRSVGGRLATRRVAPWQWDHGAQYVTARSPEFQSLLTNAPLWAHNQGEEGHVGGKSQSDLIKPLLLGTQVELETEIVAVGRNEEGLWRLCSEMGPVEHSYHALILALPAAQARALLTFDHPFDGLRDVRVDPCWALMIATPELLDLPAAQREPRPHVAWLAADHSKPGRPSGYGQYVMHASAAWSEQHLELSRQAACADMLKFFYELTGTNDTAYAVAHRWRYALTRTPLGQSCLLSEALHLGLCGDWCLGARAEDGYLSGRAAGEEMAALLAGCTAAGLN